MPIEELRQAIQQQDLDRVRRLLQEDANKIDPDDLLVALKDAAKSDNVDVVKAFLENPQVGPKLLMGNLGDVLKESAKSVNVGVVNAFLENKQGCATYGAV